MYELREAKTRLVMEEHAGLYSDAPVRTAEKAVELLKKAMETNDREYLVVLNLDTGMHPLNYHIVSIGGVSNTYACIPGIFKTAILSNASYIIVAHNHPSSGEPSECDHVLTKKVIEAGQLMEIPLRDHVVFNYNGYMYSFYENNKELFV